MKFRILENVLATFKKSFETYYIYKNPTSQELNSKEDTKFNRAIIDLDGNLYMEAKWVQDKDDNYSNVIHNHLLEELHKLNILKNVDVYWHEQGAKSINYALFMQRDADTFDFYLAESYQSELFLDEEKVEKFLKAAKKKNPKLNFHFESIDGITGGQSSPYLQQLFPVRRGE